MIRLITLIVFPFFGSSSQGPYKWVKFELEKRSNKEGKTIQMNADIYFSKQGEMVSHFISPAEAFIINNEEGEMKIYNPERNEVFESVNYQSGSQNTTFYYFLKSQAQNMGLKQAGFELADTKIDGDLLISYWEPPKKLDGLSDIELVVKAQKPIFMGYRDKKDRYIKKVFYYDYENLVFGVDFPMSITEIDYLDKDSIVSKTTFKDFRFNDESDRAMLDFKIPADAKLIE